MTTDAVAVTGIGAINGSGRTVTDFWTRLTGGGRAGHEASTATAGIRVLRCADIDGEFSGRDQRRLARSTRLGLLAARAALADAGNPSPELGRGGVVMGTAANGAESLVEETRRFDDPAAEVEPFLSCRMTGSQRATSIATDFGWTGPCRAPATACAAGNDAIADGVELIRSGRCDMVIAGGTEAPLSDPWISSMHRLGVVASAGIGRPFDEERDGFVMAEGAAALVLESAASVAARQARPVMWVAGWHSTCDAFHLAAPAPDGAAAAAAMQGALDDAGLKASDLGAYFAHATGTRANDVIEAEMVRSALPSVPIVATKGTTGHPFAATAALEAVACALSFRDGLLPPIVGLDQPDSRVEHLDLVRSVRPWTPAPVLSASFGLGGVNTGVVFLPPQSESIQSP